MKLETLLAIAVKSSSAAASAVGFAFGLNVWAWVSAIIGAAAAYHIEGRKEKAGLVTAIIVILALAFFSALMASALPSIPKMHWSADVLVEVRSGLIAPILYVGARLFVTYGYDAAGKAMAALIKKFGGAQ